LSPVLWGVDSGRAIWTQNFRQSLNCGRQRVASFCTFSYLDIIRRSCILMVLFHARSIWSVRIVVALEYFQEYIDTLAAQQGFLHWLNHYVFFSLWSRPLKVLLQCIALCDCSSVDPLCTFCFAPVNTSLNLWWKGNRKLQFSKLIQF